MDNILNEKTLCRILQGRLRCSLGDPALYIYEPTKEILEESADLIFHLMILLEDSELTLYDVEKTLKKRMR